MQDEPLRGSLSAGNRDMREARRQAITTAAWPSLIDAACIGLLPCPTPCAPRPGSASSWGVTAPVRAGASSAEPDGVTGLADPA
jgi:hypothetical protein